MLDPKSSQSDCSAVQIQETRNNGINYVEYFSIKPEEAETATDSLINILSEATG